MNGKGDKRRPAAVDPDRFATSWERTFGARSMTPEEIDAAVDEALSADPARWVRENRGEFPPRERP